MNRIASHRAGWRIAGWLIALAAIPVIAALYRTWTLAVGVPITPENARFFASPAPVLIHVVGSALFLVLGAFQFVPSLRRSGFHRLSGRLLVPAGLAAALSALWMTHFYALPAHDGPLLDVFRWIAGGAMTAFLLIGLLAIRRGAVARHRACMSYGYALGAGAGSQALIMLIYTIFLGEPVEPTERALLMGAGWTLNLGVAAWALRRR